MEKFNSIQESQSRCLLIWGKENRYRLVLSRFNNSVWCIEKRNYDSLGKEKWDLICDGDYQTTYSKIPEELLPILVTSIINKYIVIEPDDHLLLDNKLKIEVENKKRVLPRDKNVSESKTGYSRADFGSEQHIPEPEPEPEHGVMFTRAVWMHNVPVPVPVPVPAPAPAPVPAPVLVSAPEFVRKQDEQDQTTSKEWSIDVLLDVLKNGSSSDNIDAAKAAEIIDEEGKLTKRYHNWEKVSRTSYHD